MLPLTKLKSINNNTAKKSSESKVVSRLFSKVLILFSLMIFSSSVYASCDYQITNSGQYFYSADITVTNTTSDPVSAFDLAFSFDDTAPYDTQVNHISLDGWWPTKDLSGPDASGVYTVNVIGGESIAPNGSVVVAIQGPSGDGVLDSLTGSLCGPAVTSQSLTLVKEVINDDGRNATVADFGITTDADLTGLIFGAGNTSVNTTIYTSSPISVSEGTYTLVESDHADYTEGAWSCTGASGTVIDTFNTGSVVIGSGENVTCTIVNDDIAEVITLPTEYTLGVCSIDPATQFWQRVAEWNSSNGGDPTLASEINSSILSSANSFNAGPGISYTAANTAILINGADQANFSDAYLAGDFIDYTIETIAGLSNTVVLAGFSENGGRDGTAPYQMDMIMSDDNFATGVRVFSDYTVDDNIPTGSTTTFSWITDNLQQVYIQPSTEYKFRLVFYGATPSISEIMMDDFAISADNCTDRGDAPYSTVIDTDIDENTGGHYLPEVRTHYIGSVSPDAEFYVPGDDNTDGAITTDEESGVVLPIFTIGQTVTITVPVTGAGGLLNAWIDWDGNEVFDADEKIATDAIIAGGASSGTITLTTTVPSDAVAGTSYGRFRWSPNSVANAKDFVAEGELEDYELTIIEDVPVAPATPAFPPGPGLANSVCSISPATSPYQNYGIKWDFNGDSGTSPDAIVSNTSIFASAIPGSYVGIDAMVSNYSVNINADTVPTSYDPNYYIEYQFTTEAFTNQAELTGFGVTLFEKLNSSYTTNTGAYNFAIAVDDDASFASPEILINEAIVNDLTTADATVATAVTDNGKYLRGFAHWDANGTTVSLDPGTTYTARVYPYGVTKLGDRTSTDYTNIVIWDDFILKAVNCAAPPEVAELTIDKTVVFDDTVADGIKGEGDTLVYSFLVTAPDTNNVDINNLVINDATLAALIPAPSISCPVTTLAPDTSTTCIATAYTITIVDVGNDEIVNTASASGATPSNTPVTSPVDAVTVILVEEVATLTIDKTSLFTDTVADGINGEGDTVVYSFLVTAPATNNVEIDNISINDPTLSALGTPPTITCPVTTLAPGASTTCTATAYTITAADEAAGEIKNTASATGTTEAGSTPTSPTDTETVVLLAEIATLTIDNTSLFTDTVADGINGEGDTVVYSSLVTAPATNNVEIDNISINDPTLSALGTPPTITCPVTTLAAGASTTCTATAYTITAADEAAGEIESTASATGTTEAGSTPTSPTDTETVVLLAEIATLTIDNTSLFTDTVADGINGEGDTVVYSSLVTAPATNNVEIDNISINDPTLSALGTPPTITCPVTTLAPGASTTCTATAYTITAADEAAGEIESTASATGTTEAGSAPTSPTDTETVALLAEIATLTIDKTSVVTDTVADGKSNSVGDTVVYSFLVTAPATNNVEIDNISINDPTLVALGTPPTISCPVTTLAPGASTTCTATPYAITATDVTNGEIENTASAAGTTEAGSTLTSPTDTEIVEINSAIIPDDESGTSVSGTPATPIADITDGNMVNGQPAVVGAGGNATITEVGTWPAGITLEPLTGAVSTDATVQPGTYVMEYELCDTSDPANCEIATVTIVVTGDIIPDDEPGIAPSGALATPIADVTDGDMVNGQPVVLGAGGNATISESGTWPAGFSLDPLTGAVNTDATVQPGTYTMQYELCDTSTPANCELATVTVVVEAPPVAKDDTKLNQPLGQAVTINPLANDSDLENNLDPTTVMLVDASGNPVTTLLVTGVGPWTVDPVTGAITFTPESGFLGNPTPVDYMVKDTSGYESNVAKVTIEYEEPAALTGTVWVDADGDGVIDADEERKAGWTLQIKDADGNIVATTVTDAEGNYSITALIPDEYTVEFYDTEGILAAVQTTGGKLEAGQSMVLPLPLTIEFAAVTELADDAVLLTKSANKTQVSVGDQVYYTIVAENKSGEDVEIDILDDIPHGFKFTGDSAKLVLSGADLVFDKSDYEAATIVAAIDKLDPIKFGKVTIKADEKIQIGYILKVGTGVQSGSADNRAQAFGAGSDSDIASSVATATVTIVADSALDQSTLIGKVFHDRDGDGYQDPANVTGITVKSDYFGWNSLHLGGLNGRISELDNPAKHHKVVRMPWGKKNDFKVTTQQGTIITVDNRGQLTESHTGLKAKGLSAQDIRLTTKRTKGIPTQTPVVAMRKPAKVMDVLEITITNYGIQEEGIPGVRLVTVTGLNIETDSYGRYHIPDVNGGRRGVGQNFIVKVDTATLPDDARFTTENPRVIRLTGAALNKVNFGVKLPVQASPYRVEYQAAKYRNETVTKRHTRKVPVYKTVDVNLGSIFFDKDKHHIRADQRGVMDDVVNKIKQYGRGHITIDAFTDSRHHAQYNIVLAKRRAHSVRAYLMKRLGHKLMKNVKVEIDPKAYKDIPHNDPRAIDYKRSK